MSMIMLTWVMHQEVEDHATKRSWYGNTTTFKYIEPFSHHFCYRHHIDDHNNNQHAPISIEEVLVTKDWNDRVHVFLIAVMEVNAKKRASYFQQGEITFQC